MPRAAAIDDLFGHVPQKADLPLATASVSDDGLVAGLMRAPPGGHTADSIRIQALTILDAARAAQVVPWNAELVRRYTALFPYWAEWLKNGEGDRLLAAFKAEMDRLGTPDALVAPNWARLWGLPTHAGDSSPRS